MVRSVIDHLTYDNNHEWSAVSKRTPHFLSTMPVFDTGYFMQQDHIQPFVMKQEHEDEDEDEDSTLALIVDIDEWWLDLPRDIQKRTPLLGCLFSPYMLESLLTILSVHIPEGKNYHDGVIWFRTR